MGKKILIIEDELAVGMMISYWIKSLGHDAMIAADGAEGFKMAKTQTPDLIITDVLMPNMDGFTFFKELKKNKLTSNIPVIILTARGKMEDSFKVLGADDFIAKPFEEDELISKIERLLRKPAFSKKTTKKILLAGSSEVAVMRMVTELEKGNFDVNFSWDGTDVIAKAVNFSPDIIVMDVLTPGIKAHEVINLLRQMPQSQKAPILLYSYFDTESLGIVTMSEKEEEILTAKTECLAAGATFYIEKFSEFSFVEAINKYL